MQRLTWLSVRILFLPVLALFAVALPLAAQTDLAVTKQGAGLTNSGTTVNYSIDISNLGSNAATSVTMTDVLPTGMTFASLSQVSGPAFNCTTPAAGSGGTITCTIGSFAAGSVTSMIVRLTVTGAPAATVTNTATVSSSTTDTNPANNSSSTSTTIASADVAVSKTGPTTAAAGSPVSYPITMTNFGPTDSIVDLQDVLPAQLTFLSFIQTGGSSYTCTVPAVGANGTINCHGFVPAGRQVMFSLQALIAPATAPGTLITNTAQLVPISTDPNSANNASSADTLVASPGAPADLSVTKTGDTLANAGSNAAYTITVTNNGPNAATSVELTDTALAQFSSFSQNSGPAFTCNTPPFGSGGAVTCDIASLAAGQSATFGISWKVGGAGGSTTTNTASVTSASPDPNPANNFATQATVIGSADVGITKTGPATAAGGANFTYTITVANAGPTGAAGVTFTDPLPPAERFVSLTQTGGPAFNCTTPAAGTNGTVDCSGPSILNSGASATFSLVVNTAPTTTGPVSNTATIPATRNTTTDPNPANNSSTATTTITLSPAIPALSPWMLALLAFGLALVGYAVMRT